MCSPCNAGELITYPSSRGTGETCNPNAPCGLRKSRESMGWNWRVAAGGSSSCSGTGRRQRQRHGGRHTMRTCHMVCRQAERWWDGVGGWPLEVCFWVSWLACGPRGASESTAFLLCLCCRCRCAKTSLPWPATCRPPTNSRLSRGLHIASRLPTSPLRQPLPAAWTGSSPVLAVAALDTVGPHAHATSRLMTIFTRVYIRHMLKNQAMSYFLGRSYFWENTICMLNIGKALN